MIFNRKILGLIVFMLYVSASCSCVGAEKKEVKASKIISMVKKGKPVHLVNRIIVGDLDFTLAGKPHILNANTLQCEIQSNLFFEHCVFMGKVTSNGLLGKTPVQCCFRNNLVFNGCDFRGEVDFSGAIVFGMLNFSRTIFCENVIFNNMAVWSKDSFFSEMKSEKRFLMVYSSFAGNLTFINATFEGIATFQETSAGGKLVFNNSVFKERVGFDMIEAQGNTFFNYARFEKNVDFSWARFLSAVEFVNTSFEQNANFEKTTFMNTVNFEGVDQTRLIFKDTKIQKFQEFIIE